MVWIQKWVDLGDNPPADLWCDSCDEAFFVWGKLVREWCSCHRHWEQEQIHQETKTPEAMR